MTDFQAARFGRLCREIMVEGHTSGEAGIGTLAEKRLHAVIKRYLCEDEDCHEVGVLNTRFVSDVRIGNEIYEVQTGSFYPMKKKIAHYLEKTDCTVTVVHPIPARKWVSWIDPKTNEIASRTHSTKRGRAEDLLPELYHLLPHLGNPRLRFRVLLLEAEDFRWLNGWSRDRKRGSERYERIPLALLDDIEFNCPDDFAALLPDALPQHFAVKDFSKHTKIRGRDAYSAVRALAALGILGEGESIGRSMGWVRCIEAPNGVSVPALPDTKQQKQTKNKRKRK